MVFPVLLILVMFFMHLKSLNFSLSSSGLKSRRLIVLDPWSPTKNPSIRNHCESDLGKLIDLQCHAARSERKSFKDFAKNEIFIF